MYFLKNTNLNERELLLAIVSVMRNLLDGKLECDQLVMHVLSEYMNGHQPILDIIIYGDMSC